MALVNELNELLSVVLRHLLTPLGFLVGSILLLISTLVSWSSVNNVPDGLEWAVPKDRMFYVLRGRWQTLFYGRSMMLEAYERFSKKDEPYVWINAASGPEIVQPPSQIATTIAQPDNVLSTSIAQERSLQIKYTGLYKQVFATPLHIGTTRQALTGHLSQLNGDIIEELLDSLENQWGSDTSTWRSVDIMATIQEIVARTSNRIFVGVPLCRNRGYLDACIGFAVAVSMGSIWITTLPSFMKPVLGRVMTIPGWIYFYRAAWHLKPLVCARIAEIIRANTEPGYKYQKPCDFLQWTIDTALDSGDPSELDPYIIAARVVTMNFAAIHTSLLSTTHMLLDIIAAPTAPAADGTPSMIDQLRAESAAAYTREGNQWSRKALSHMHKLDSCLRESLRLNGFVTRGLARVVVAEEGYRLNNGVVAPKGALLTVPAFGIGHDPDKWGAHPWAYDGFRFSRVIEAGERERARREEEAAKRAGPDGQMSEEEKGEVQRAWLEDTRRQGVVTTSDSFLQFGHGKHACPGRFFAANEIKFLMTFILREYDIEPLAKRPENGWFMDLLLVPMGVKIKIRKRKEPATSVEGPVPVAVEKKA